ncbi:MAG TPA: ethylbenzene dehydrogenase-related protein [Dehalococcoidia bacterium]|nr:ethylbenzene dehydrogenase-related protein [Dehalococcoidia bacterium]
MVTAVRVSASDEALLDPEGAGWRGIALERIELDPTPIVLQPSEYVQTKWKPLGHGGTPEVRVAAAHNGTAIYFRLEWDDETDNSQPKDMADFPDQAGVMLPIKDDAPISEMGLPDKPVNMWLWRADLEAPLYVTATGRGATVRQPETPLSGRGRWSEGVWRVVVSRPFNVSLPAGLVVPLAPGVSHKCTFAVWQGAAKERGGLKAFQPVWQPLEVER